MSYRRSFRPLPSPYRDNGECSYIPTFSDASSVSSVGSTGARPLPMLPKVTVASAPTVSQSRIIRPLPTPPIASNTASSRPILQSLNLSPSVIQVPSSPSLSPISSTLTPISARRRRLSKLRRHFGESVSPDLVADDSILMTALLKSRTVARLYEMGDDCFSFHKSLQFKGSKDIWDMESGDESSESDSDLEWRDAVEQDIETNEQDIETEVHDHVQETAPFKAIPLKRYSKRWYQERGSKRWELSDYNDVLQRLRTL